MTNFASFVRFTGPIRALRLHRRVRAKRMFRLEPGAGACGRFARASVFLLSVLWIALSLSGCAGPQALRAQGGPPSRDAVRAVQEAVDRYKADTGLLPIKNGDPGASFFEKFVVDFGKLQRMRYVDDIPVAAFERGGSYYFLVLDETPRPRVKLMSLRVYQQLADIEREVAAFSSKHGGLLPRGKELYPGYAAVDFAKLGRRGADVRSVFSGSPLPVMMDDRGRVYADYARDMMAAAQKNGLRQTAAAGDLRMLLTDRSDYVPVKSPPYRLVDGEPVPLPPEG